MTRPESPKNHGNLFDRLPDDLIISILINLSLIASSPPDLISLRITCKILNRLVQHPRVLSRAGVGVFQINSSKWSVDSHKFFTRCAISGNIEACYVLGMIRYYCLGNKESGMSLMAKAALRSHGHSLYSLAVVHFNKAGRSYGNSKDVVAGVSLCARAACVGHVPALRELGHCFRVGYGVRKDPVVGSRLLAEAESRAAAYGEDCDPVRGFLRGWFENGNLGCSGGCGRAESMPNDFRRCSVCYGAKYCSRGCQAVDWKIKHSAQCLPHPRPSNIHELT